MVKLVLRLTRLAKLAAMAALLGAALWIYGGLAKAKWAGLAGTILFFPGVVTYYVERYRMMRNRSGRE